jgi:hypothetical protein
VSQRILVLCEIFFYFAGNDLYLPDAQCPDDEADGADIQNQLKEIIFRQYRSIVMDGGSGSSQSVTVGLLDHGVDAFQEFSQMDASRIPF